MTVRRLPGPPSLFRGKLRAPVSITLTPRHHAKVNTAMRRLGLTRADVIALLIDRYADTLTRADLRATSNATDEPTT